jgi:hypothetical protein
MLSLSGRAAQAKPHERESGGHPPGQFAPPIDALVFARLRWTRANVFRMPVLALLA